VEHTFPAAVQLFKTEDEDQDASVAAQRTEQKPGPGLLWTLVTVLHWVVMLTGVTLGLASFAFGLAAGSAETVDFDPYRVDDYQQSMLFIYFISAIVVLIILAIFVVSLAETLVKVGKVPLAEYAEKATFASFFAVLSLAALAIFGGQIYLYRHMQLTDEVFLLTLGLDVLWFIGFVLIFLIRLNLGRDVTANTYHEPPEVKDEEEAVVEEDSTEGIDRPHNV